MAKTTKVKPVTQPDGRVMPLRAYLNLLWKKLVKRRVKAI